MKNVAKMLRLASATLVASVAAFGGPATLPSVSVTGVTATSPVVALTSGVNVSATVTANFDSNSLIPSTNYDSCNPGDNFCGSGDLYIKSKKVVTTTATTVSAQTTTVTASDFNSSGPLSGAGTTYTGALPTPTSGTDGYQTVTVNANVSELVTTCTTVETSYWTGSNGSGTQVGSTTTVGPTCDGGVTKIGSGSGTSQYVLDINAPILTLKPITSANMASDLTVASTLASAAIVGALANVEINLSSLKDADFAEEIRSRVAELQR